MADKQYPSDDKVTFIVCEDVRPETGKKVTFLGAYTARVIEVNLKPGSDPAGPKVLGSLGLYFGMRDAQGSFAARVELFDPDDVNQAPPNPTTLERATLGNIDVIAKIQPFKFKLGTYKVRVFLDDHVYERTFLIKESAPKAA